jgi:hypothetical protein
MLSHTAQKVSKILFSIPAGIISILLLVGANPEWEVLWGGSATRHTMWCDSQLTPQLVV